MDADVKITKTVYVQFFLCAALAFLAGIVTPTYFMGTPLVFFGASLYALLWNLPWFIDIPLLIGWIACLYFGVQSTLYFIDEPGEYLQGWDEWINAILS